MKNNAARVAFSALGLVILLTLAAPSIAKRRIMPAPVQDNGCNLRFTGSDREGVKLRPANLNNRFINGGRPSAYQSSFPSFAP